jgi:hypothetical protein
VIDEQAHGTARRRPAAGDQLVGVPGTPAGNLKAQVEVEVALSPGLARAQPPVAAAGARAEPSAAHEQARREPSGLDAQLRVGGGAEVRQQRDRRVGVRAQEIVEGVLVEAPDRRRDLLELRMGARELIASQGPAAALLDDIARFGAAQRLSAPAAGRGLGAFPFAGSGSG